MPSHLAQLTPEVVPSKVPLMQVSGTWPLRPKEVVGLCLGDSGRCREVALPAYGVVRSPVRVLARYQRGAVLGSRPVGPSLSSCQTRDVVCSHRLAR